MNLGRVRAVVLGAGVIGLACARRLALAGFEPLIIEKEPAFGTGISARNSEVIHAGLYYPQNSLKARLCVAGKAALYEFCESRGIPSRRLGKLVVASRPEEEPVLHSLMASARGNGVDDLRLLDAGEARTLEPELRAIAALHSPSSGIVDTHALMLAFLGEAENHGARLVLNSQAVRIIPRSGGFDIEFADGSWLQSAILVNATGLSSAAIPVEGVESPPTWMAKGSYFALSGPVPFSRLIYPVPETGGLGVHLTLDMAGQAKFGPDVEWVDKESYDVDGGRREMFASAIRKYWPGLDERRLSPAYAGIRPKLAPPGQAAADFRIDDASRHGHDGLICLHGIESPGLTASLAIADHVLECLRPSQTV